MIGHMYSVIVDFNVSHAELWSLFTWINDLGTAKQAGLLGAGIGLERLLDILADEADQQAHRAQGTPRAIEGPLYIPNAPLSQHEARLDDGSETGEPLVMEGTVRDTQGKPVPQAIVDVWHAGQGGGYSFFDPSLQEFNYRRRIETDRFIALRSHYLFESQFTTPGIAGAHEKGGIEGEVGRFRRNHLVPVPQVADLAELNALLLAGCEVDLQRRIVGREMTVGEAWAVERPLLRPLPAEPFDYSQCDEGSFFMWADAQGATVYLTLEPCDHVGRTGPCTAAQIDPGVALFQIHITEPKGLLSLRV
jgi:pyrimidine deaminase RibD-like protein